MAAKLNIVSHEADRVSRKRLLGQIGNATAPGTSALSYSQFKIETDGETVIYNVTDEDYVPGVTEIREHTIVIVDSTTGSAEGKAAWLKRIAGDATTWTIGLGDARTSTLRVNGEKAVPIYSRLDIERAWFAHLERVWYVSAPIQTTVYLTLAERPSGRKVERD